MDQLAEAIALMVQSADNKDRAKAIVEGLTEKYPLNA